MVSISPLDPPPFQLGDALDAVDQAESPAARLQAAADALHTMGFGQVVATLRDPSLTATMVVVAGHETAEHLLDPLPGAVWRRRVGHLERFRIGDLYLLDGSDSWVAREFFGCDASPTSHDSGEWLSSDLLLGLLRGPDREVIGIVKMVSPVDGRRPGAACRREISWLLRHTASRISHDVLRALAQRRAERLQRLQEAGAALARSLDEGEIVRELVRQATRASGADGASLSIPDLDEDRIVTAFRLVRGSERPREPRTLGHGVIAHVARTGRAFRMGDRVADRELQRAEATQPLPSIDDIADDGESAASVLAVPLLVGIRLVGVLTVHSASRDVFSAEDEEMLATMASQAATAIANARRYAESERERRQIEALAEVARAVGESLRLGEVLRLILRHSIALLGAKGACIALRDGEYMHIVAAVGAADVLAGVYLPVNSSLLGRAVTTGELSITNDFRNDPNSSRAVLRLAQIDRSLIAPLVTARGTVGAIAVINRDEAFVDEDARVLKRLSDQVSVAIVNARLFEEVERATREWKVAFDAIANGMIVLDENGMVTRCNARSAELIGEGSFADLLGQSFGIALMGTDGDTTELDLMLRASREQDIPVRGTIRSPQRGRVFDLTISPHPDGGSVLTLDDVTEVHGLAERHRRVLEMASEAIIITGTDRRVAFANPAAQALFDRKDLIGARTTELIRANAHEQLLRAESAAMAGTVQRYELPIVRPGGEARQVSISSAPLVEVGKITGTVACIRDVTDQRADALALARSEARYSRLVEAASDAIFTVDLHGLFTSVNASLVEATGRARETLIGAPCIGVIDPRDRSLAHETLQATGRGERRKVQLRFLGGDGRVRVAALMAAPIMDDNVVTGSLGIVRDITEDELLREATAQQEQLATMGRVLGGIANELNNPLSSLLAVAELGAGSPTLASPDRIALEQIRDEARRASRIVKHLLGISREPGAERAPVRVNDLVRETIDLHGYSLRNKQIPVRLELAAEDPEVQGNGPQLQQVLVNLVRNAEEALTGWQGRAEIVIRTALQDDCVCIVVSDTGPGISPAFLPHVFEPLSTTNGDNQMRGLGLAVSSAVVKEHGGTIGASSTPGLGATFRICLPTGESGCQGHAPARAARTARGSILIVEDEATLRHAMERYLSRSGFTVSTVESGPHALAAIAAGSFDVILLDLRMPGMQGDEVYRRILATAPELAPRVIFVTGDLHNPEVAAFVEQSGRFAIAKPFLLAELMERVEKQLA